MPIYNFSDFTSSTSKEKSKKVGEYPLNSFISDEKINEKVVKKYPIKVFLKKYHTNIQDDEFLKVLNEITLKTK